VIFVDSNVPMYVIGGDRRLKGEAELVVARLIREERRLVTSSEVFQELLHRYGSSEQQTRLEAAFEALRDMVDDVLPVTESDVFAAKGLLYERPGLSVRDVLHLAVMRQHGIEEVLSFDTGFDAVPGVARLPR
jgi:predicted nucleic acid-binding protein